MERIPVEGGFVEGASYGTGDPVLLIHGSLIADAFAPLIKEPALAGKYRLLDYHRRGFVGSSRPPAGFTIAQQAADALAVMKHFGVGRAHVAGHSYGGTTALQLALDAPEVVHTLGLLEPGVLVGDTAVEFWAGVAQLQALYEGGDKVTAADAFMQAVVGPDYRETMARTLPAGWFEQVLADIDTFFGVEVPAIKSWEFGAAQAKRVAQPALAVLGADSAPLFVESHAALKTWLPNVEPFVLPGATHGLQMQNPRGMAEGLAAFFGRHSLS
jgi:pimeloyl-ACP methyl ester carboxylesterase